MTDDTTATEMAEDTARAEAVLGEPLNVSGADAARVKWWHFSDDELAELMHAIIDSPAPKLVPPTNTFSTGFLLHQEITAEIERRAA